MTTLRSLGWVLLFACGGALAHTDRFSDAATGETSRALMSEDFDRLERLQLAYSEAPQHAANGELKMQYFDSAVMGVMRGSRNDGARFHQHWLDVTQRWIDLHPASPLAYVLHARALLCYAYYFRGEGGADTVAPPARASFQTYAKKAAEALFKNAGVAAKDTSWNVAALDVGIASGWQKDFMLRIVQNGAAKNPADFRLYESMAQSLLNDPAEFDRYVNQVAAEAPQGLGMEFYARLYDGAAEAKFKHALYKDSLVDWRKMKRGLQDWIARYPVAWSKNVYAYHACMAGDKPAFRRLLGELRHKVDVGLWDPNGRVTFEGCKRWAESPTAPDQAGGPTRSAITCPASTPRCPPPAPRTPAA